MTSLPEPVARYLDALVVVDLTCDPVLLPVEGGPLKVADLARVIDDPTRLHRYPQDPLDVLVEFVCWLPDQSVPAEFVSRVARLRFLVWSLAFRLDATTRDALFPSQVRPSGSGLVVIDDLRFGLEARAARRDWLEHVDAWEEDPWLARWHATSPTLFEHDLRLLTTRWPRHPAPLVLATEGTDLPDEDHQRIAADVTELHWLPRASLASATAALRPRPVFLPLLPMAAALSVLAFFVTGAVDVATWSALVVLACGLLGVMFLPLRTDFLLLLRIPAATLVGSLLLLSLTPRWWLDSHSWRVGAGLLVLATAYIVVEARLHGSPRYLAWLRGAGIAALGIGYATLLNLAILRFVTPSLAERGECLLGWWRHSPWDALPVTSECAAELGQPTTAAPAGMLLLMTGWSLAAGLLAQILWDDRPLTAPLGRLRRVRGGSR